MNPLKRFPLSLIIMVLTVLIVPFGTASRAQENDNADRTLSPYFFVKSDDTSIDQLPLKATSADVNISGVIADVLVTQVYKNEGRKPLEAIYIFPASTRAAVYGMKMTIGERVIVAKIDKREAARRQYEQARDSGRSASLLEQQRPNVFQMNVANIMPGDEIKVELTYTELLVPADGIYEFVYPTVVGPRYSNQSVDNVPASEHWVQNPYLRQDNAPTYSFDINATVSAGLFIQGLTCTSHKVKTTFEGPSIASVALDRAETTGGNRDYILRYRLAGDKIQSGLLLYEGEKEKFFLLMMQPPKRMRTADIPGLEYIFIVDVSGSMYGFPLDISKKLLKDLISNLRASDRFNVLLFAGGSSLLAEESLPATADNLARAITFIESQQGGGGTELLPALTRALALKRAGKFSRTVVIATDGYVTVEEEAFDIIRARLHEANIFAFGIGTSVNRHLIEGMAHVGMGEPFVVTKPEEAPAAAQQCRAMIQSPVLTRGKVEFQGFDTYDVEPPSIPDVFAERPVIMFGKWRGHAQGKIKLTGVTGEGSYSETITVKDAAPSKHNAALRYLWARHRITVLSDYNILRVDDKRVKEVTDLGLTYNLLTAYTSFVAIDNEVRNQDGKPTIVKQPLPLPQGVSDYAVGGLGMAAEAMQKCASAPYLARGALNAPKKDKEEKALTVRLENITASEGMTEADIRTVASTHLDELKDCVITPGAKEKITLTIVISPDGTVKALSVAQDTKTKNIDTHCLIKKMKTWRFPAGKKGREISATITLVFES
jgi:Ca-activated chloride channel family protein